MDTDGDAALALMLQLQEQGNGHFENQINYTNTDQAAAQALQAEEYRLANVVIPSQQQDLAGLNYLGPHSSNEDRTPRVDSIEEHTTETPLKRPASPSQTGPDAQLNIFADGQRKKKSTDDLDQADELVALALAREQEQLQLKVLETTDCNPDHRSDCNGDDDIKLACSLARKENELAMEASLSGKAWNFVHAVLEDLKIHPQILPSAPFEPVAKDDMHFMVERLLEAQAVFRLENKDTSIDIGYHYTRSENLERIKTDGLLTYRERQEKGVTSHYNGSMYGDGIYSGNNPYSYNTYGDVGLLVARLKGDTRDATPSGVHFAGDTALAYRGTETEMVILRESYQCVPLLKFRKEIALAADANESPQSAHKKIWHFHCRLQRLIDQFFNHGNPTIVNEVAPPSFQFSIQPSVSAYTKRATAFRAMGQLLSLQQALPTSAKASRKSKGRCDRCFTATHQINGSESLKPLTDTDVYSGICIKCNPEMVPSAALAKFQERYLPGTAFRSEEYGKNWTAPHCNAKVLPTMRILWYKKDVLNCGNHDSIAIIYNIPVGGGGCEKKSTSNHMAFLPGDEASAGLLNRLKLAFCTGFLFDVCDDLSASLPESDVKKPGKHHFSWTSVPHKTSPYEFPDTEYIPTCHKALDRLGVLPAEVCGDSSNYLLSKKAKPHFSTAVSYAATFCHLDQLSKQDSYLTWKIADKNC